MEEIHIRDIHKRASRWRLTIPAESASLKNRRREVRVKGKPKRIPNEKALAFKEIARLSLRPLDPLIEGPVRMWIRLFFAQPLADLDDALVMDTLQGLVYVNDRQVMEVHKYKRFSRYSPRVEVEVEELQAKEWEEIKEGLAKRPRQDTGGLAQQRPII